MHQQQEKQKTGKLRQSNQESKNLTREYIRTALMYLLKEHNYENITVTAIIQRAGVSRAGFYRNYTSKDDLLEDLASEVYRQVVHIFSNGNTQNTYEKYLLFFEKLKSNAEWFRVLTILSIHNKHIFHTSRYVENYTATLSPLEHYRNVALFHSQRAIILNWFEHGMKESPEEMATILSTLYNDFFYLPDIAE